MRYLLPFVLFLFTNCEEAPLDEVIIRGDAFGTTYAVKYFGKGSEASTIQKGIDSVIYVVNKSMSTYMPNSDISKINAGDTSIRVDDMFLEVFMLSRKVYQISNHYFDPTVGGLRNAYGFGDTEAVQFTQSKLDSMMQYVGFDKMSMSSEGKVIKEHPEMYLDFNAVAKGYGIDRIAIFLEKHGKENFLVELGGEISAKGINLNSEKVWTVGVESIDSPRENRTTQVRVGLTNKAMASSGNYRKNRLDTLTGKMYVHTINPISGSAEKSDVLSATVIANSCAEADAYATSFMAMGLEQSKEVLRHLKEVEAYLVFAQGEKATGTFVTAGFEKLIK